MSSSDAQPNQIPPVGQERTGHWQTKLEEHCISSGFTTPVYHIASDKRGGRTAWSSAVDVNGRTYNARYWYDGRWIENAKEDAANVALEVMEAAANYLQQQQQQGGQLYETNSDNVLPQEYHQLMQQSGYQLDHSGEGGSSVRQDQSSSQPGQNGGGWSGYNRSS